MRHTIAGWKVERKFLTNRTTKPPSTIVKKLNYDEEEDKEPKMEVECEGEDDLDLDSSHKNE